MKTTELIGPALDWAVAKCEGLKTETWHTKAITVLFPEAPRFVPFQPSREWAQGGPIIERERLSVSQRHDGWWRAWIYNLNDEPQHYQLGPTPLIAAMRCFVAAKLGDEVEVPKGLE